MKRKVICVCLLIFTVGCNKNIAVNNEQDSNSSMYGKYEYIYPYNTDDLVENHYIVLSEENGRYYGTSDDFDHAREGYLPGFYVSVMQNLVIEGDSISFTITLNEEDLFINPIDHLSKTTSEVLDNSLWIADYQPGINLSRDSNIFTGNMIDNEIHLEVNDEIRVFKKIELIN